MTDVQPDPFNPNPTEEEQRVLEEQRQQQEQAQQDASDQVDQSDQSDSTDERRYATGTTVRDVDSSPREADRS